MSEIEKEADIKAIVKSTLKDGPVGAESLVNLAEKQSSHLDGVRRREVGHVIWHMLDRGEIRFVGYSSDIELADAVGT